jgi:hypothetical protein
VGAGVKILLDLAGSGLQHQDFQSCQELLTEWLGAIILFNMNVSEQELLFELINNPPMGSKIKTAKEFGVDLTLNLRSLRLSPAERVPEMESALKFAEQLREGVQRISR